MMLDYIIDMSSFIVPIEGIGYLLTGKSQVRRCDEEYIGDMRCIIEIEISLIIILQIYKLCLRRRTEKSTEGCDGECTNNFFIILIH